MTTDSIDRIERNLDRMERAFAELVAERDALNESASRALAAQLAAETTLDDVLFELWKCAADFYENGRRADSESIYAARLLEKYAPNYRPSRSTEDDRRAFASAQRSEESGRPPVPGVK